jgi:C1A family cysteine protease
MNHRTHRFALRTAVFRTALSCCLLLVATVAAPALARGSTPPDPGNAHASLAPLSPAFLRSQFATPLGAAVGQGLGGDLSPRDFAYSAGMQVPPGIVIVDPGQTYDLRTLGRVTSVKNQGPYGTCWSFAGCGSLESCLLPGETRDFSEDNLLRKSGFDLDPYYGGGHIWMSMAYLVRWGGPVNESEDAYGDSYTPAGLTPRKHVQEVSVLPLRGSPFDNDNVKLAVIASGGVDASMGFYGSDSGSAYYNPTTASYYYYGDAPNNHEVLIVGWDDNYPAANFATAPPGNGAFIVKDSRGSAFGQDGYIYVSYFDSVLGRVNNPMAVFSKAEPTSNFTGIYQYDPLGHVNVVGFNNSTAWFANIFNATASSALGAVGFYTEAPNTAYEIYTGTSLATRTLATSGALANMGYHTVTLPSPVGITQGKPFVVAVKVTSPGTLYPIAVEYPIIGYSSAATAGPGQSYYSEDGSNWLDSTTDLDSNLNVCLKAYTVPAAPTPPTLTSPNGGESWTVGSSRSITWSTGNGGNVKIELSRNGGASWETLFASTANDGSQSWTVAGASTAQALVRISNDNGSDTSDATFSISSAPVDTTPPTVAASGNDAAWHNHAVTIALTASDTESGVLCLWWSANDDPMWNQIIGSTGQVTVPAPADHSWDRDNTIWYCGEDTAGNHPELMTANCHVKIDTRKPITKAPYATSAVRGTTATLRYKVIDTRPGSPTATVTIKLKNRLSKVVKTLGPYKGKAVNKLLSATFKVPRTWKAGTYRFYVYAKDAAGNAQVVPVGSNRLIVR